MAGLANWAFDACRAWCGVERAAAGVACWAMAKGENAATARASAQQARRSRKQELVDGHAKSIFNFGASTFLNFKAELLHGMICEPDADCR
jgi:hypothetical protein